MESEILVIGAGPAGLAVAATLGERGKRSLVIEKAQQVGASWRSHYERLHLHTVKALSALPGLGFADDQPRYVPRQGVVDYLSAYAARFAIAPRFGEEATRIVRAGDGRWQTTTRSGETFRSHAVVVSTGANNVPFAPTVDGQETFAGTILHSRDYRSAAPFAGKRVLVVGMGNTGAEIALDLAERGVAVALSVRSPVNIVYRDVLGRPAQQTSITLARLPTRRRCGRELPVRRHGRRHRPLGPASLARLAAARPARERPHAGDRRRHAGTHQGGRDRRPPRSAPPGRRRRGVRRRPCRAVRCGRPRDRIPVGRRGAFLQAGAGRCERPAERRRKRRA
jgi:cation diffusion facilitator CzcD-associated flavoprotein CzcO